MCNFMKVMWKLNNESYNYLLRLFSIHKNYKRNLPSIIEKLYK